MWPWRVKMRGLSLMILWEVVNLVLSKYEDNVWSRSLSLICSAWTSGLRKSARRYARVAKQNQGEVWPRLKSKIKDWMPWACCAFGKVVCFITPSKENSFIFQLRECGTISLKKYLWFKQFKSTIDFKSDGLRLKFPIFSGVVLCAIWFQMIKPQGGVYNLFLPCLINTKSNVKEPEKCFNGLVILCFRKFDHNSFTGWRWWRFQNGEGKNQDVWQSDR